MRLDFWLVEYDFTERHRIKINSSTEEIFQAIYNIDMGKSGIIKLLFRLRGLYGWLLNLQRKAKSPSALGLNFSELLNKSNFFLLEEDNHQEMVIGLIGQFWKPVGKIVKIKSPAEFTKFNLDTYAKVAWNFYLEESPQGEQVLSTETRILCFGHQAKILFTIYWAVIRPFSGWIRREMLRLIKEQAQNGSGDKY